jgi:hypothetical protein
MPETRKNLRESFDRPVWAVLTEGERLQDCVLREVWPTGARLRFPTPLAIPASFVLHLAYDGRVARKCEVTNRAEDGQEVEVAFLARRIAGAAYPRAARDEPRAARPAAAAAGRPDKASLAC